MSANQPVIPKAMRKITILLSLWLVAIQAYSQIRPEPDPLLFRPATHSKNLKSTINPYNGKSFYQSKADWQTIIDTTWGPGPPLDEKLAVFNAYTNVITENNACFIGLGIDPMGWDSIKKSYRARIDSSTSMGAFAALMGRLAYNLRDVHISAWDTTVLFTPLNPGTPVLVIGLPVVNHFGAVLTVLPDSSLLVLRVMENHPLGLQPGDVVLGYEGVAWKDLVDELFASGIPIYYWSRGAKSALRYHELASAGMNWHLFETIDIVKYVGGDTLHLPVYPLANLPVPLKGSEWYNGENLMWSNNQIPVLGVPFPNPDEFDEHAVNYGIIEGTNIGYIYLLAHIYPGMFELKYSADEQFYKAVKSLFKTEGLIIDLRYTFGGWSLFDGAFKLLYNIRQPSLEDVVRCKPTDFSLCPLINANNASLPNAPAKDPNLLFIPGNPMSWYDKPLAVLTSPNCLSCGDITAYRLTYHPMARFFGKSTCASLSYIWDLSFPGWILGYSKSNFYHVNNPGILLSQQEFPVDDPVWFNREGAANGEDAVVNKTLEWIQNVSYAHKTSVNPGYAPPGTGEVTLSAKVENPNGHDLSVNVFITSLDSTITETISLADDGNYGDVEAGDGIWSRVWRVPDVKAIFSADLETEDPDAETSRTITSAVRFTTLGPVVVNGITIAGSDTIPDAGDNLGFKVILRNQDLTTTVTKIRAKLTSLDTTLAKTPDMSLEYADMAPGQVSTSTGFMTFYINIADDCPPDTEIPVKVEISSDYYTLWTDTISFLVPGLTNLKETNTLSARVYPNPAEDRINIEIDNTGAQETMIELVSVTGIVVYRKEYRNSMDQFKAQIDVSDYARGMYFVRIRRGGGMYNAKIVLR